MDGLPGPQLRRPSPGPAQRQRPGDRRGCAGRGADARLAFPRTRAVGDRAARIELDADLAGVDIPYYRVTAEVMASCVGFHLNRGVLAAARRPPELSTADVIEDARTIAVLEGVNDHENLGSIFRNAAGLGVDAVIFGRAAPTRSPPGGASLDGTCPFGTVRERRAVAVGPEYAAGKGISSACMTPDRGAEPLARAMPDSAGERVAILVGAEGPDLTESAMRASDVRVRVPMARGTDSLEILRRPRPWRSTSARRLDRPATCAVRVRLRRLDRNQDAARNHAP